jgi:protein-tyrosine-phosphatase
MPSILFVCSANQCRSPMAEALFISILEEAGVRSDWRVESAGVWAYPNIPATDLACQAMRERGLDIEDHRAQAVTEDLIDQFDLVLVMEDRHRKSLQDQFPAYSDRVRLLSEVGGGECDIVDPVTGTLDTYRATVDELIELFRRGYNRLLEWVSG